MVLSKAKRLSKVAREFNVGISTIVEFLNKKGYELDENPNAKVSPKCYDVLIQEYSKDYEIKKEKEEVTLRAQKTRNETITIDDIDELVNDETENSTEDIVIIKDTSGFVKEKKEVVVEKEKKEKVEEIKIDTKKAEVKVVGK
ncbi:MAG: translation initiation factor IF-2, partial [Bacteroidetes bacterium]